MGPSALRVAGLQSRLKQLGRQVEDIGNVPVPQPEEQPYGEKRAKYLEEIAEVCKGLAEAVKKTLDEDMMPLVLGGDHSIAVGTIAGVAAHFDKDGKRIGLIWLDAHGDMNTPDSSPSGNVHGMPLASIMGYGPPELTGLAKVKPMVEPRNVALVGIRDLDSKERKLMKDAGVHAFTMRDIDERGMREVMAGSRDACAWRSDLPRGTLGAGDGGGQPSNVFVRTGGGESGDRCTQHHGDARRGACAFGAR